MRNLSIIFFLFFFLTCYSQKSSNELKVEYKYYMDGTYPTTYPAVLYVKDSVSIYKTMPSQWGIWNKADNTKQEKPPLSTAKKVMDGYLKINHHNKTLLTFDILPAVSVLVKDDYPDLSWSITKETKVIAGYTCAKANTIYRGREWIAWFTPDIAMPYGPWKLHGLPGLILEVYSKDEKYTMKAVSVAYGKESIFDVKFESLRETHNKKPITYQQFLIDRQEAFENIDKEMRSEGIEIVRQSPPRAGLELKYEWEQ